jgi:integrase
MSAPEIVTVDLSIQRWRKRYSIGKKPLTLHYHGECEQTIRKYWHDLSRPIHEVTDDECVEFAKRVEHYSTPRFNNIVNYIRQIIPAAKIIPRRKYVAIPKNVPTPAEFERILAALDVAQQGNSGLVVRFLAHTGMRINEARLLKWADVREDHILVPGEISKNCKPRCIPFVPGTREVINALKRVQKYHHDRRAFVLPQGRCAKALKFACRLCALPSVTHHTFRHYFATQCIKSGVDIPTVAKWLGHSDSGALLLKTYTHLIDEHTTEMAKRVKVGGLQVPQETAEAAKIIPIAFSNTPLIPPQLTDAQPQQILSTRH